MVFVYRLLYDSADSGHLRLFVNLDYWTSAELYQYQRTILHYIFLQENCPTRPNLPIRIWILIYVFGYANQSIPLSLIPGLSGNLDQ